MSWTTRGHSTPRATHFVLCFNRGPAPLSLRQLGHEVQLDCGEQRRSRVAPIRGTFVPPNRTIIGLLLSIRFAFANLSTGSRTWWPRPVPNNPALRHLRQYLEITPSRQDAEDDPELFAHVGTTLTDLVALALGAGQRRNRIGEVARPACGAAARDRQGDPDRVRRSRRSRRSSSPAPWVSPIVTSRTLLHESGSTFTQRVLELRLQRARAMLGELSVRPTQGQRDRQRQRL